VAQVVEEFRPAFHPVLGIDANHPPSLVVERRVLAIDPGFENKIPADRKREELPIVGDVSIKCLSQKSVWRCARTTGFSRETVAEAGSFNHTSCERAVRHGGGLGSASLALRKHGVRENPPGNVLRIGFA
jgi:hypothetical protein